jgi:elongation factor G
MSFEIAGSFALRNGVQTANPVLLEPVMKMSVTIPDDSTGEVIGDLNTRRARILGMNPQGDGITLIEADAPMALIQTYATDLRALTQARGTFSVSFGYYDTVPPNEAAKVILNANSENNSAAD